MNPMRMRHFIRILTFHFVKPSALFLVVGLACVVQAEPELKPEAVLGPDAFVNVEAPPTEDPVTNTGYQFDSSFDRTSDLAGLQDDPDEMAAIDPEFLAAEMKEVNFELSESFDLLHRADSAPQVGLDLSPKFNMCAATSFAERKRLLKHVKVDLKTKVKTQKLHTLPAFVAEITPLRNQISEETRRRSEKHALAIKNVVANFQKSCQVDFDRFIPEIKRQAKKWNIPAETFLAMMTIESRGDCFAAVEEGGKNAITGRPLFSRGLFQVHANFTRLRACSEEQKEEIRNSKSVAKLKRGPTCLENPVYNLREAARILASKAQALFAKSKPYEIYIRSEKLSQKNQPCWQKKTITVQGFDKKRLIDKHGKWNGDLWRMVISAYNGGERWVFRAKRNIEVFNQLHGTHVDAHNWSSLRDYYFRRTLNHKQQLRYFGVQERDRDLDYAILNVMYAESLMPSTEVKAMKQKILTLADVWRGAYLKKGHSQGRAPTSK